MNTKDIWTSCGFTPYGEKAIMEDLERSRKTFSGKSRIGKLQRFAKIRQQRTMSSIMDSFTAEDKENMADLDASFYIEARKTLIEELVNQFFAQPSIPPTYDRCVVELVLGAKKDLDVELYPSVKNHPAVKKFYE